MLTPINFYHSIKIKIASTLFPNKYVLTRTACLGNDVFSLHNSKYNFKFRQINVQKGRVDLLIKFLQNDFLPVANTVYPFLEKKYMFPLIKSQQRILWNKANHQNQVIIMDSFSELTDQLFIHKNKGWSFCAHYSDIKHSKEFSETFTCLGLLDESLIYSSYKAFFDYIKKIYPNKKVVFIHFPASLDNRILFQKRENTIFEAIHTLKNEFNFLYDIRLETSEVFPCEGDNFPYHFSEVTKKAVYAKWPNEASLDTFSKFCGERDL